MRIKLLLALMALLASMPDYGQDTARSKRTYQEDEKKLLHHEIGFNGLALLSQLEQFEAFPQQLPYMLFYNIYYRDVIGLRLGAGGFSNFNQEEKVGEITPKLVTSSQLDFRLGVSYNFFSHKRVTFNAFADFLVSHSLQETVTTNTIQIYPDPVLVQTTRETLLGSGRGMQAGFGLKVNLSRHVSLYTEMPLTWMLWRYDDDHIVTDDGGGYNQVLLRRWNSNYSMTIPASVYFVLRF